MKMKLEKGDQCFVRLLSGEVVVAKYERRFGSGAMKYHWVRVGGESELCGDGNSSPRFQYPVSEMKRQMGLQ